eukprot:gnl/MRDRNA2_/MRDRNA2_97498_c0_seq1.p1 gnl/MRDRNA2_/MRDRNA2_97498_c0~~gnl/MRDRNA2_/MRDRNA2_97498_c0_seq1.p1  ORF type:complete len:1053 (-),score=223.29 gnl/MRDRNA2_/MRDRNA2_97498_c0_seq1:239-3397(-)
MSTSMKNFSNSSSSMSSGSAPGCCPNCPGPTVPHHCGLIVPSDKGKASGKGKGKDQCKGKGLSKGEGKGKNLSKGEGKGKGDACESNKAFKGSSRGFLQEQHETVIAFGFDTANANFSLRGAFLGQGGQNIRYISEETGVRIHLEGPIADRDASCRDDVRASSNQIRIVGRNSVDLDKAKRLICDLLGAVKEDYEKWCAKQKEKTNGTAESTLRQPRGARAQVQAAVEEHLAQAQQLKEDAARLREEAASKEVKETLGRLQKEIKEKSVTAKNLCQEVIGLKQSSCWDCDALREAAVAAKTAAGDAKEKKDTYAQRTALESAEAYWQALEAWRAQPKEHEGSCEKLATLRTVQAEAKQLQDERLALLTEQQRLSKLAAEAQRTSSMREQAAVLLTQSKGGGVSGSGSDRMSGCCALYPMGACPFSAESCPRGRHGEPPAATEDTVFARITRAKLRLLQQKWSDAGGHGQVEDAWQVRNPRLEFLFRATECGFNEALRCSSDAIDAWHGSAEENVFSIAINGFDPKRRCGQVYGAGEYFAKDPNVSIAYAKGGAFMFLCKLLLGEDEQDHTWVSSQKYYVIKQREGRVQALPLFVVRFKRSSGPLSQRLKSLEEQDCDNSTALAGWQRGGLQPEPARRNAGMVAKFTRHLWLGWLAPQLCMRNDDAVQEDVEKFLEGYEVAEVIPERNGARIGAFVLLRKEIDQATFKAIAARRYHGQFRISVDDQQPNNPACVGQMCPRLTGPSKYCRGWNLHGHSKWQWGCPFEHPENLRPTHGATFSLEEVAKGTAKFDEIESDLLRSSPFQSADGGVGQPQIVRVQRVVNDPLSKIYEERRGFLHDKHGFVVEKELWHGTNCKALPELLTHGLQPPSDTEPCDACPQSGGKSLCTTLCGTDCRHCSAISSGCCKKHRWNKCHMYGLGVYLADLAQKSHRYVRRPTHATDSLQGTAGPFGCRRAPVYSMIRCRVCLGNPYLIEGNLLKADAMHDMCWCQDPTDMLESNSEEWNVSKGHDSYFIRGLTGAQKAGLGVYNNEYVVFHPYQILPLYQVDYVLK